VATTGQILNIQNVDEHPLINQNLSEFTGFKARNVLCFPVKNENEVIGAVQLCNKRGGSFNYFDEEIANTLSVYCGLSIMHSLKYTQVENFQIRNFLSDELMIYYVQVSEDRKVVFEYNMTTIFIVLFLQEVIVLFFSWSENLLKL
jgi:cGMP-dependent 3',5'-cyclic phosphodiesterase